MPNVPIPDSDHNRVALDAKQLAEFTQCAEALADHYTRTTVLLESAFRQGARLEQVDVGLGVMFARRVPDGSISACPHCVYMLVHTLRETADLFEDVARRLELKEPDFAQWQRKQD